MDVDEASPSPQSVARRVLGIPEILSSVLSHIDQRDCARFMRVSTTWLRPAMLAAWTEVCYLEPILCALGLMERRGPKASDIDVEDDLYYLFPITVDDWARASRYFECIQSLYLGIREAIAEATLLEVALSRPMVPNRDLFPNLKTLRLSCHLSRPSQIRFATTFLHDGITEFQLIVTHVENDPIQISENAEFVISEATMNCPQVSRVLFLVSPQVHIMNTRLLENCTVHLQHWEHLRVFKTSPQALKMEVVMNLVNCDKLEEIRHFGDIETFALEWAPSDEGYTPIRINDPDALASLGHLELFDTMEKVVKLFGLGHIFSSLHSVSITTPYADGSHLVVLLQNLARSCPSLRKIGLSQRKFPGIDLPTESGVPVDQVSLRFLYQIQGLEEFRLEHAWPVFIHDEAVVDFISHLPRLRTLHLNPNPIYAVLPLTTFGVLGMISERCPWVQDLALYLTPGNDGVHSKMTAPTNVLRNLTKIRFGKTLVPDALRNSMMSYLSQVLPPNCDIITDSTEPLDGLPESVTTSTGFTGIHAFWRDVGAQWQNRRSANS